MVELAQRRPFDAAGAGVWPPQPGVDPAAAPRPAGDGAEFAAALADQAADLVLLLGRERPLSHAGRIGLANAAHIIDRRRTKPGAVRRLRGDRVRGGDERLVPVVAVKDRSLSPLKQNSRALAPLAVLYRLFTLLVILT